MIRMVNLRFIYIPNQLEGGNALPIPWLVAGVLDEPFSQLTPLWHACPSDFLSNVDVGHILRLCREGFLFLPCNN